MRWQRRIRKVETIDQTYNINSYDWNELYDKAEEYLRKYSDQFHVNRGQAGFPHHPEVCASIPVKGNQQVLKMVQQDEKLTVRRGYTANGQRFANVSVRFHIDGTL